MKPFTLLLTFTFAGVCLGAEKEPAKTSPKKEATVQGKTLGEWTIQAKDKDLKARIKAAEALGEMGPAAIPALIELLLDKDYEVRRAASSALKPIIGPAAIPALTELLRDKKVRSGATETLGKIGSVAIPALTELLKDDDAGVRKAAADALEKITGGKKQE